MCTNCVDFVDQIFKGGNAMLAKALFHKSVVGEGNSLFVYFPISSLVHKLADGFSGRISALMEKYPKAT